MVVFIIELHAFEKSLQWCNSGAGHLGFFVCLFLLKRRMPKCTTS